MRPIARQSPTYPVHVAAGELTGAPEDFEHHLAASRRKADAGVFITGTRIMHARNEIVLAALESIQ